jgi:Uma2 family endonuclease
MVAGDLRRSDRMPRTTVRLEPAVARIQYEGAARRYLESLPPEHFMESTFQSRQREITLASLALVRAERSDFHLFNELLVQYPLSPDPNRPPFGQVVPDNMVVLHPGAVRARGSYDVVLQPAGPFWVLEYVSESNRRKDHEANMEKYERDLKVPYYTLFEPEKGQLLLFKRKRVRYAPVPPDDADRCPLPELDLELGVHDGWLRYWYKGELLPLPADLARELNRTKQQLRKAEDEIARLRGELDRLKKKNGR